MYKNGVNYVWSVNWDVSCMLCSMEARCTVEGTCTKLGCNYVRAIHFVHRFILYNDQCIFPGSDHVLYSLVVENKIWFKVIVDWLIIV